MASQIDSTRRAAHLADILKALGHPARLRIVAALCGGGQTVTDLSSMLCIPQAIVSQQLRILRMSGLVEAARKEGFALYTLAEPRLRQLVKCLEGCSSNRSKGGRT
jgi:DNA-binding transcriptional ArsR family regulator